MSVNETDIELLESYLDDELSASELDALRKRLSSEPALASAMDELRGQREMRGQFFAACDPDEMSVERLVKSVRQDMNREMIWRERSRVLGRVGSLAACLLVGFFVGHGMHDMPGTVPVASHMAPVASRTMPMYSQERIPAPSEPIAELPQIEGGRTPVRFDGPSASKFGIGPNINTVVARNNQLAGYQVNLVDSSGNVVKQYDSLDQAVQAAKNAGDQTGPLRIQGGN